MNACSAIDAPLWIVILVALCFVVVLLYAVLAGFIKGYDTKMRQERSAQGLEERRARW